MRAFFILLSTTVAAISLSPAMAQSPNHDLTDEQPTNPQIDFPAYVALAQEVRAYRNDRLLDLRTFRVMADRPDALLLDARSAEAFAHGHMDGAVNLPLPDFTAQSLAELIGTDRARPILIYCNNNFVNDIAPVIRKAVSLALNIQTMINLRGYGYTNIYELGEAIDLTDSHVRWVGGRRISARFPSRDGPP